MNDDTWILLTFRDGTCWAGSRDRYFELPAAVTLVAEARLVERVEAIRAVAERRQERRSE